MRKLKLNRETLRCLDNSDLAGIAGGAKLSMKKYCGDPIEFPTEGVVVTCQGYTHLPCNTVITCTCTLADCYSFDCETLFYC